MATSGWNLVYAGLRRITSRNSPVTEQYSSLHALLANVEFRPMELERTIATTPISEAPLAGVIFDLDGTLTDTLSLSSAAFASVLGVFTGRDWTDAEIEALHGPNEEGIIRAIVPDQWGACLEAYLAFHSNYYDRYVSLWPDVRQMLEELSASGLRMAIATARGPLATAIVLERAGIREYFDLVVCGEPHGAVKARNIRNVVEAWSCSPEAVVYVGDTPGDMSAAAESGTQAIGAAWGRHASVESLRAAGAAQIFESLISLQQWLIDAHERGSSHSPSD